MHLPLLLLGPGPSTGKLLLDSSNRKEPTVKEWTCWENLRWQSRCSDQPPPNHSTLCCRLLGFGFCFRNLDDLEPPRSKLLLRPQGSRLGSPPSLSH